MACEKCAQAGHTKIIHFERCGRWETRVFCAHTYTRATLNSNELRHVLSRDKVEPRAKRRAPQFKRGPKIGYTEAMDAFILLHYPRDNKKRSRRGSRVMGVIRDEFEKQFGKCLTKGQLIGRWHRLREAALQNARPDARHVPSLPKLRFMEGPDV